MADQTSRVTEEFYQAIARLEIELAANPHKLAEISAKIRDVKQTFEDDVAKAIEQERASGSMDDSKADRLYKAFRIEHLKPPPPEEMSWEEKALVATVNKWWEIGAQTNEYNYRQLLGMAKEIGLNAEFYRLGNWMEKVNALNIIKTTNTPTAFAADDRIYTFRPEGYGGGWFGYRGLKHVNGPDYLWILPADPNSRESSTIRGLLPLMFKDIEKIPSEKPYFVRAYRALELVSIAEPNRYLRTSLGYIHVQGSSAPNLPLPPAYDDLLREKGVNKPKGTQAQADFVLKYSMAITKRETFGDFIRENEGTAVGYEGDKKFKRGAGWYVIFPIGNQYFAFLNPSGIIKLSGTPKQTIQNIFDPAEEGFWPDTIREMQIIKPARCEKIGDHEWELAEKGILDIKR